VEYHCLVSSYHVITVSSTYTFSFFYMAIIIDADIVAYVCIVAYIGLKMCDLV